MSKELSDGLNYGFEAEPNYDIRCDFQCDGTVLISFHSGITDRFHLRKFGWQTLENRLAILDWINWNRREGVVSPDMAEAIWAHVTASILDHVAEIDRAEQEREVQVIRHKRVSIAVDLILLLMFGLGLWVLALVDWAAVFGW